LVLFSTTRGTSEVKQCSRLAGSAVPGNHDSPGARWRVLCGDVPWAQPQEVSEA